MTGSVVNTQLNGPRTDGTIGNNPLRPQSGPPSVPSGIRNGSSNSSMNGGLNKGNGTSLVNTGLPWGTTSHYTTLNTNGH